MSEKIKKNEAILSKIIFVVFASESTKTKNDQAKLKVLI